MYTNLVEALRKKGISINAAASAVKMAEATFRTKVQFREFSVEEAFTIKDNLFPESDIRFLFARVDDPQNEQKGA